MVHQAGHNPSALQPTRWVPEIGSGIGWLGRGAGRLAQHLTKPGGEPAPVVTPGGLTQQEIRQRGSSYAANQKEMEAAQRSIQSAQARSMERNIAQKATDIAAALAAPSAARAASNQVATLANLEGLQGAAQGRMGRPTTAALNTQKALEQKILQQNAIEMLLVI